MKISGNAESGALPSHGGTPRDAQLVVRANKADDDPTKARETTPPKRLRSQRRATGATPTRLTQRWANARHQRNA